MLTKGYLATARHWRPSPDCPLPVKITFCPPDRRHRDDDNMIASFKSGRDGMCEALGLNDRLLRPEYHFSDPITGGAVIVEVECAASPSSTGKRLSIICSWAIARASARGHGLC